MHLLCQKAKKHSACWAHNVSHVCCLPGHKTHGEPARGSTPSTRRSARPVSLATQQQNKAVPRLTHLLRPGADSHTVSARRASVGPRVVSLCVCQHPVLCVRSSVLRQTRAALKKRRRLLQMPYNAPLPQRFLWIESAVSKCDMTSSWITCTRSTFYFVVVRDEKEGEGWRGVWGRW